MTEMPANFEDSDVSKRLDRPSKPTAWQKIGGGSLAIAIIIHGVLLVIGAIWVFKIIAPLPDKVVDFMPGSDSAGGSERSAKYKVQQKKLAQITPTTNVKRVFAEGATSDYSIPEQGEGFGEMSSLSSMGGGGMSGGLGGSGGGTGFGKGTGGGLGSGGLGSAKLFGLEIKDTRQIAVVMDVSRSMTKYLPIVAKELDKIAAKGPLILYFGCGLTTPAKGMRLEEKIKLANGPAFDRFWQHWQGSIPLDKAKSTYDKVRYDKDLPMPLESLYKQMSNRPDTFFLDYNGIQHTQPALLGKELREADTIYWFADFMDKVDDEVMEDVLKKLKSRNQKLYIHGTIKGKSFEAVRDKLAIPSGGGAVVKDVK
jgi:hypothetical protein